MGGLANWPPSRGVNPHTHDWILTPNITRKDLPAPERSESVQEEKDLIDGLLSGRVPLEAESELSLPDPAIPPLEPENRPLPLLEGTWSVWYQVTDVAALSLKQANRVIRACEGHRGDKCDEHLSNWWKYEPRDLWVDIDYPLSRGVRLCVKPFVMEPEPCEACERDHGRRREKRVEMTPGYLLWMIAKEYERIYSEHEKYGIWGHGIEDLGFERITINKEGVVELFVGS